MIVYLCAEVHITKTQCGSLHLNFPKVGALGAAKNTPQTKPKEQTLGVAQMHQGVTRRD